MAGDLVDFYVTFNGDPVQARVTLDVGGVSYASNATTGLVQIPMPSLSSCSQTITLSASIFIDDIATTTILVYNPTKQLSITVSPSHINECEPFLVYVSNQGEPQNLVEVQFNQQTYYTNASGYVTLVAPDVLYSKNYGLFVNKTGFESNFTFLTIFEYGQGEQLLEVVYPSIVEPGSQILVQCLGLHQGIENVSLGLWYEEALVSTYTTDDTGSSTLTIPTLVYDNYCILHVEKSMYNTSYGQKEFRIWLVEDLYDSALEVETDVSEIDEDELFTLTVYSSNGSRIEGASVWRGTTELEYRTDTQGEITVIASHVFMDRTIYLFALKDGYNVGTQQITIRDVPLKHDQLQVIINEPVYEQDPVIVTVYDSHNLPLEDVLVVFHTSQQFTDSQGQAYFFAPEVLTATPYTITASKYGYTTASVTIDVLNYLDDNGSSDKKNLHIFVIASVLEQEEFTVTVHTQQGTPLCDAYVEFFDQVHKTNTLGVTTFQAPDVFWDTPTLIHVSKTGYTSSSASITVKSTGEIPFWLLLIVIVIIFFIGGFAYWRYRYHLM